MATLEEAICNVRQLENIILPDEQPTIEAPPASVTYTANFDANFEDSKAFITCISKYLEEADVHKGLVGVSAHALIPSVVILWQARTVVLITKFGTRSDFVWVIFWTKLKLPFSFVSWGFSTVTYIFYKSMRATHV